MSGRHALTFPIRAAVARRVERARLTERPAATIIREECAHQTRVCLLAEHIDLRPRRAAISRVQQVSAGFVVRLEVIDAALADEPAVLCIRKVNVEQRVFRWTPQRTPDSSAIVSRQQHAFAADSPPAILIQKIDRMKPGERTRTLLRPRARSVRLRDA